MIGRYRTMNWRGYRRKLSWPSLRHYSRICLEGQKNHENIGQDSWCPGQDLNLSSFQIQEALLFQPSFFMKTCMDYVQYSA